ncbi:UNVERIFIED_CONTAM: hypothetical protein Sradi_5722700 [Sesamum radiatum]|uniref:Uncharacterized protein n=1 Tax=Sesamum radiatum TaxID=300843 RepID=A0AAW2L2X4_SESRA
MQDSLPSACSDPLKQRPAQPAIYSSSDLLQLHDHVIARARCGQQACCDHPFMRPREPAAAKWSALYDQRPATLRARIATCRSASKSESVS